MAKWAIELSEYGVEFQLKLAIKAQVLADFLVEMTKKPNQPEASFPTWMLHVDGLSTANLRFCK